MTTRGELSTRAGWWGDERSAFTVSRSRGTSWARSPLSTVGARGVGRVHAHLVPNEPAVDLEAIDHRQRTGVLSAFAA